MWRQVPCTGCIVESSILLYATTVSTHTGNDYIIVIFIHNVHDAAATAVIGLENAHYPRRGALTV